MSTIYVLAAGNERGGATTHLLTLASTVGQAGLSHQIRFVVAGDGYLAEKLTSVCEQATILPSRPAALISSLVRLLSSERDVVLHSHGPRMNVLGWLSARLARVPWTTTLHSNFYKDFLGIAWKTMLFTRLHAFCLRRSMGLFVVSDEFRSLVPGKTTLFVPNSILLHPLEHPKDRYRERLAARLGLPDGSHIVGIAARFDPVKDIATIIRAVSKVSHEDVHLAIAGDGAEAAMLRSLADELNVENRVHFLGYVEDVHAFYAGLQIHVLASRSEGTPFSVLEAAFYGAVNVGSNIPGIAQLVTDGITGLLFPRGDADALAERIDRLIANPELIPQLSAAFVSQVLPRFVPSAMLSAYLQGYRDLFGIDLAPVRAEADE